MHRSIVFRSFSSAALAALTAGFFASNASALGKTIGGPIIDPPPHNPVNDDTYDCTLAATFSDDGKSGTCADVNWVAQCTNKQAACKTLVNAAMGKYVGANTANVRKIVLPTSVPHPVDATHDGSQGALYDGVVVPPSPITLQTGGPGGTYESALLPKIIQTYATHQRDFNHWQNMAPLWLYQETSINACAEYTYKKWYEYSVWDDYVHFGKDPIVSRAQVAPRYLSTLSRIDGTPISRNGTVLPIKQAGDTIPRNTFLAMPLSLLDPSDPAQKAILDGAGSKAGTPITLDTDELSFADFAHSNSLVSDATLLDNARRMGALSDLYRQYADLNGASFHNQLAVMCLSASNATACRAFAASGGDDYAPGAQLAAQTFGSDYARRAAQLTYFASTNAYVNGGWIKPFLPAGPMPANTLAYYQSAKATLDQAKAGVQKQIQQAYVAEWAYNATHGCLGYHYPPAPGSTDLEMPANSCDFQPVDLMARYTGLFQTERQRSFDRCMADTGDDFTVLENPNLQGAVFYNPARHKDFHVALDTFDGYLNDYENRDAINTTDVNDAKQKLLVKSTALPLTGSTNGSGAPQSIGEDKQDGDSMGNDFVGGGYSYHYGWHIVPKVQNPADPTSHICSLSGDVEAGFEAHATVVSMKIDAADMQFRASTQPGKAMIDQGHFTFLGKSIFNADGTDLTAAQFNQPFDFSPPEARTDVPMMIGPIPLTVGYGIGITAGATVHAGAVAPPIQCDPNNLAASVNASVTPHAGAYVRAWAGLGFPFLSVGIEGKIDLLTLNAPMTVDLHLANDPNAGIELVLANNAQLDFNELSGNISLYAEAPFVGRAEMTLLPWAGFHQSVPLFNPQPLTFPLTAINYRMYGHFDPKDPHSFG